MSRYLLVDIGAGTMDVLYFDDKTNIHYKAVAKSPVLHVAEKAAGLAGNLLVAGSEMGGGPISKILKERAKEAEVIMSDSAALTVHHSLEKVRNWGIKVIDEKELESLDGSPGYSTLHIGDLDLDRLEHIVEGLGVPFEFDVVGICAQDHGMPPPGVSHLEYRHALFERSLDANPYPHTLLYRLEDIPRTFNRLRSMAETASRLPVHEVYAMDSGMAAILGASMDFQAARHKRIMVLDVATSHTIGATLEDGEIAGFFEYHTSDLTLERLESLLRELADGYLEHRRILAEGGHGAYIRKTLGYDSLEMIMATGPKRGMLKGSSLPIVLGAPWGDNMMTGTVGVLEAIRRQKNLQSMICW